MAVNTFIGKTEDLNCPENWSLGHVPECLERPAAFDFKIKKCSFSAGQSELLVLEPVYFDADGTIRPLAHLPSNVADEPVVKD